MTVDDLLRTIEAMLKEGSLSLGAKVLIETPLEAMNLGAVSTHGVFTLELYPEYPELP